MHTAPSGWPGPWITGTTTSSGPLPLFRREFDLSAAPRSATIRICGLGHYELRVNGRRVGDRELDPGWTDYRQSCLYSDYDLTPYLRSGNNVIAVLLGNGMYHVAETPGRYVKFTGSHGPLKLICDLKAELADGREFRLGTDDQWRTSDGPIMFSCIYGGEDHDARAAQPGWDTPGFDASRWHAVQTCEGPGGELVSQLSPPVHSAGRSAPCSLHRLSPDLYEADFDFNLSARPVLTVEGRAGALVIIRCAEVPGPTWPGHEYRFILGGTGAPESFVPLFSYFGFRFLTIEGVRLPSEPALHADGSPDPRPVLRAIERDFITSSAAVVGKFACSYPLFNDIDAMVSRSVSSNLVSVFTDCPHREKLGWQEEVHLMGPSILYRRGVEPLLRKVLRDIREGQFEDGRVSGVCPDYVRWGRDRNRWVMSAEWGSTAVQTPWMLYRWTGDLAVLRESLASMASYTRYLATTRDARGLCAGHLGDWFDWTPVAEGCGHNWYRCGNKSLDDYVSLTPLELPATAFLHDNARIVTRTARLLGDETLASGFDSLAAEARHDFLAAYWQSATGVVATGSQAAQAVALAFDLLPPEGRPAALAVLISDIEAMAYRPTAGEVCWPFVLRALGRAGRSDIICRMIDRTDKPGYGYMLAQGCKTLSETWDGPGTSMNHFMFGHVQEWFTEYVAGIRQAGDSIAFRRLELSPHLAAPLTSCEAHYDGPNGRIGSRWRHVSGHFSWEVQIPNGTQATLHFPEGVRPPLEVGPGIHRFSHALPITRSSDR